MTRSSSPTVSVCVPTYNGERYLAECLDSVLAQTHVDFELLIIDDQSSDGTWAMLQDYAARDARIRLVRNEVNRGLVGNWNHCIDIARGDWFKFVFQDDVLAPECLEKLVAATSFGFPLISCAREFLYHPEVVPESKASYERNRRQIEAIYADRHALSADAFCEAAIDVPSSNIVGEPTVTLIAREVFDRFGRFNPDLITLCDAEYWLRVACNTGTYHVPDVLAQFRVHGEGTSALNNRDRWFRSYTLDKLVIEHETAFSPYYARLREVAARRQPPVDLVRFFWQSAYWVQANAREKARNPTDPNPAPLRDLEALARRYPAMVNFPLSFRAGRIVDGVQRRAGRLFGSSTRGHA